MKIVNDAYVMKFWKFNIFPDFNFFNSNWNIGVAIRISILLYKAEVPKRLVS